MGLLWYTIGFSYRVCWYTIGFSYRVCPPHVLADKNDYQNHLPSIHGSDGSHVSGGFIYQWFPHNFISRWSQIPGSFFSFPKVQGQQKKKLNGFVWKERIPNLRVDHQDSCGTSSPSQGTNPWCCWCFFVFPFYHYIPANYIWVRLKIEYPIPSLD